MGFENGQARISVSTKEVTTLSHNTLVEPSLRNEGFVSYCPWDDFYSRIETGPILNQIEDKDISKYTAGAPETLPYTWPDGKLREGGEFVIPLDTEIFFWVFINGVYNKDEQANVTNSFIAFWHLGNYNFDKPEYNMRIDFGTVVPNDLAAAKNPRSGLWTYGFHLPIFRITVTIKEVELEMYDCGDCVFISERSINQANLLNFKLASSYYD